MIDGEPHLLTWRPPTTEVQFLGDLRGGRYAERITPREQMFSIELEIVQVIDTRRRPHTSTTASVAEPVDQPPYRSPNVAYPQYAEVTRSFSLTAAAAITVLLTACGGEHDVDACANDDEALSNAGFIFVENPRSGERVSSGFQVRGCSSTFEAGVSWRLRGRDGRVLASGVTQGGSLRPSSFEFEAEYSIAARQIGELEVFEPRVTGEGFPPSRDVVPLVLQP